jgi:CDP-diacylglycerol---serine O-phosphatidyltransferase
MSNPVETTPAPVSKEPVMLWRYALPNMVTLAALSFGLTALKFAGDGFFVSAIACILIAAVLDGFDGRVARATGTDSKFGAELDSLADVICFGAVPAYMVFEWGLGGFGYMGWAACLTFAAACALRLARFNVRASEPAQPIWRSHFFTGVPAPAAAFLSLAPLYALYAGLLSQDAAARFAIFWMPFVALLMVSTWPTFSSKSLSRKALRLFFVPTLVVSAATIAGLYFVPWATLTACCGFYLLSLPLSKLRFSRQISRNTQ